MEEEGIYYYFKHSDGNHQMVVSDNTSKHPAVPGQSAVIYEELSADVRTDMRVIAWEKIQELRSGECTLWDHTFERPTNHLEAKEKTIVSVPVGKVVHKLNLANDALEIYDYPGRYAQRFDGVDPAGGPPLRHRPHLHRTYARRAAAHGAGRGSGYPHRWKKRLRPVHRRPQVHTGKAFRRGRLPIC